MLDGRFNDILNWRYSEITRVLGAGRGHHAGTEDELEEALLAARADLRNPRGNAGDGIHAASTGGVWQAAVFGFAGLRHTADGFVIAEKDLQLRGPGELLGTRQTGLAGFRIADLARDAGLLPQVHALADHLLSHSPQTADRLVARWVGSAARYAAA